jgi:hypothetical protein
VCLFSDFLSLLIVAFMSSFLLSFFRCQFAFLSVVSSLFIRSIYLSFFQCTVLMSLSANFQRLVYLSICQSVYLSICLSVNLSISQSVYLFLVFLNFFSFFFLCPPIIVLINLSVNNSTYLHFKKISKIVTSKTYFY